VQHTCSPATLRTVVAAFQQAEPALDRCKRLLPHSWVTVMAGDVCHAQPLYSYLQTQVQQPDSLQALAAAVSAARRRHEIGDLRADVQSRLRCSGCGKSAAGLRPCSACRKASYCRWVGWGARKAAGVAGVVRCMR